MDEYNIKLDNYKTHNSFRFNNLLFFFVIFFVTIIGAYVRIKNINYHALWFDEGYTIMGAINNIFPWKDFLLGSTGKNAYPPLEFLLHHLVFCFCDISDTTARIIPCFFSVFAIPLLGYFGRKIVNPITGICASVLIAFSPLSIYLSSEARYYSHIIFAIILYAYIVTIFIEKSNLFCSFILLLSLIYIFNISMLFLFAVPFVILAVAIYERINKKFWKFLSIHLISFVFIYCFYTHYNLLKFLTKSANSKSSIDLSNINIFQASIRLFRLEVYYHDVCIDNSIYILYSLIILFVILSLIFYKENIWFKILTFSMIIAIPCIFIFASLKGGKYSSRISIKYLTFISPFILLSFAYSISKVSDFIISELYIFNVNKYLILILKNILSISFSVLLVFFSFKKPINILLGNFVKSDWKRVENNILNKEQSHSKIVCSCVELFGTPDPCQNIYLELIPSQKNLNIKTIFIREKDIMSIISFFKNCFENWAHNNFDVYFISQKDFKFIFNEDFFTKECGRHGSPAICIRKLKPYSFIKKNYNLVLNSSSDFIKLLQNDFDVNIVENVNLLSNANFSNGLKDWNYWQYAKSNHQFINVLTNSNSVLINNPEAKLCGLCQSVNLVSGFTYRVEASVRNPDKKSFNDFYGARLAINIPGFKERQVIWKHNSNNWAKRELIFTNYFTGKVTLILHMGYAKNNYSGEFKDIKLTIE